MAAANLPPCCVSLSHETWGPSLHPIKSGPGRWLLWPMECGESDVLAPLSPGVKKACCCFYALGALSPMYKVQATLLAREATQRGPGRWESTWRNRLQRGALRYQRVSEQAMLGHVTHPTCSPKHCGAGTSHPAGPWSGCPSHRTMGTKPKWLF